MAFWGAEVRSGKPRTLSSLSDKGRFHLTQATLGLAAYDKDENKGSFVQCNVGEKPGLLICSLFPGKTNMCSLNLEFDEDEEVVFSVLGPNSIHLCGFFEEKNPDEYGEDITQENSEDEEEEEDEDMSDDDDGFIVDEDDSEEDNMILSPGVLPNSGVRIEEIVDEVENDNEGTQKAIKKDKKKKKKEEDKKNDQEEQKPMSPEDNGIEKGEANGEGNKVNGENNKVSVNGKRKKKSKGNVEGEAEAEEEPPTKKQATEEAVIGVTEEAEVKASKKKKKKKSKKKAKNKGAAPEE